MADINTALTASKEAIEQLIAPGERCGPAWTAARAPGKWSPSQIVEHVARSLEESANMAAGRPSKFPKLPAVFHPLVRGLLFRRVLRKGGFPKAKTNKAMNPVSGPVTPAEGRMRLETAHQKFDEACRQIDRQFRAAPLVGERHELERRSPLGHSRSRRRATGAAHYPRR